MKWPWSRSKEIAEEIGAHLRMAEEDGASPRAFGNELLIRERTRDVWGGTGVETFWRDLGYALRQIRRAPGFAAVAILTLALGLGAITAMFSIVHSVLLEPMKYRDPGRLYMAQTILAPRFKATAPWPVNARHFHEWRTHGRSWEQISLIDGLGLTLTGTGEPERLLGFSVSYNFFRTLGVQPALGRDFLPAEELPGHFHVVILADSLWRTRFASDPSIVGRKLILNGEPNLVIGVMPPTLRVPKGAEWGLISLFTPVIFRPLGFDVSQGRASGSYGYGSIMRLKPGVQPKQAIDEMNALIADLVRQFKIESKPGLTPLLDQVTAGARSSLWLLLGTVGAVLLIVCVNVGNLMLIRTSSRYHEAGLRMALGASRRRLFGMALGEAVVLVAMGGALGLFFAYAGLRTFVAAAPVSLPRLDEVHIDWRVLAFSLAAMLVSTLICGLVPAWRLARTDAQESLKGGSRGQGTGNRSRIRTREWMVSVEVALSTVLLILGGLLMVSLFRVIRADQGFDVERIITQDFSLIGPTYTDARKRSFVESALLKLGNIPGVESASLTSQVPLRGEASVCGLRDPDRPIDPAHPDAASNFADLANHLFVGPDYWKTMGIPLRNGRALEENDKDRKVAVVSEKVARLLWPNENPIGRHVLGCGSIPPTALEVVGVAGETRVAAESESPLMVYEPYWDISFGVGSFVLRTRAEPSAVTGALHSVLRSLDSDLPIGPARTMEEILDESVAARRFETYLAAAFAVAALALASLGIYGIVSFSVARRTPEIGIRMALGARGAQVARMVLRQGMAPVAIGLAAGVGCASPAGRFIASQLYSVAPNDPLTIAMVALLLPIVAAGACWVPARRAMRIDPMAALRFE